MLESKVLVRLQLMMTLTRKWKQIKKKNEVYKKHLFIYFWLGWASTVARGLPPVARSGGSSSSRCEGVPLRWPLSSWNTGSRAQLSSCGGWA